METLWRARRITPPSFSEEISLIGMHVTLLLIRFNRATHHNPNQEALHTLHAGSCCSCVLLSPRTSTVQYNAFLKHALRCRNAEMLTNCTDLSIAA